MFSESVDEFSRIASLPFTMLLLGFPMQCPNTNFTFLIQNSGLSASSVVSVHLDANHWRAQPWTTIRRLVRVLTLVYFYELEATFETNTKKALRRRRRRRRSSNFVDRFKACLRRDNASIANNIEVTHRICRHVAYSSYATRCTIIKLDTARAFEYFVALDTYLCMSLCSTD